MANLAQLHNDLGHLDKGEEIAARGMSLSREALGQSHPRTLIFMRCLAMTNLQRGRLREAESLLDRLMKAQKFIGGENHPNHLIFMSDLALVYSKQER